MKAITFEGIRNLKYGSVPDPIIPDQKDAIVKVEYTAVCGSDLHVYHGRETGLDIGTIMGHEFTGYVVEKGAEVKKFRKGDHVVSPFTTNCGLCDFCKIGLTARCLHGQLFGWMQQGKGLHGAQAEYIRVPFADTTLMTIPESISSKNALMAGDILSTGYYCAEMAEIQPGKTYVVLGCGPVGLCAILSAFELGADKIYAIDPVDYRLEVAKDIGASDIPLNNDTVDKLLATTRGIGAEAVMEVVGNPEAQRLAYDIVRPGGIISTVGVHTSGTFSFTPVDAYNKNISFKIGRSSARHYMNVILPKLEQGRLNPEMIITHIMELASGPKAYDTFDKKEDRVIKILLKP